MSFIVASTSMMIGAFMGYFFAVSSENKSLESLININDK
jgi:hypothetical protein